MQRQRIVKFVTTVDINKQDWGVRVDHPTLKFSTSGETEAEALEKMEREIARRVDYAIARGELGVREKSKKVGR